MQDQNDQSTSSACPERVAAVLKELGHLSALFASVGEPVGAANVLLARERMTKLRSGTK